MSRFFIVELKVAVLVKARDEAHAEQRVLDGEDSEDQALITEEVCSVTETQNGP